MSRAPVRAALRDQLQRISRDPLVVEHHAAAGGLARLDPQLLALLLRRACKRTMPRRPKPSTTASHRCMATQLLRRVMGSCTADSMPRHQVACSAQRSCAEQSGSTAVLAAIWRIEPAPLTLSDRNISYPTQVHGETIWVTKSELDDHKCRPSASDAVALTFSEGAEVSVRVLCSDVSRHIQCVPPLDDHQVVLGARTRRRVRQRLAVSVRLLAEQLLRRGGGIAAAGLPLCI